MLDTDALFKEVRVVVLYILLLFRGKGHPLVCDYDSIFTVVAVLGDKNSKTTCHEDDDHGEEGHAKEILGLAMNFFRILRTHSLALESLRTFLNRPAFNSLDCFLGGADHGVHVAALEEEKHGGDNVHDEDNLQGASIAHQHGPPVLHIAEKHGDVGLVFPLINEVLVHFVKLLL